MSFTDLATDLRLPPDVLAEKYEREWRHFERSHWWPWYEEFGTAFFAPKGSAGRNPPIVIQFQHSSEAM